MEKKKGVFLPLIFALIGVLFVTMLFAQYILGNRYWIFSGVASDSYGQLFPSYYNAARRIADGANYTGWDFIAGLGNNFTKVTLDINGWILFFGEENVAYLMGVNYVIKILLSWLLFYHYLREVGRTRITSYIFSMGYAFCGHMILRGRWENMPRETLLIAFWLVGFEVFFKKKDLRLLPLATVVFLINSGSYQCVLYAFVFSGYAIFRYCTEHKFNRKTGLKYVLGLSVCLLIAAPVIGNKFEGISKSVNSKRFDAGKQEMESIVQEPGDLLISMEQIQAAFFRTIGLDIVGAEANEYSGAVNTLEDATFYCGIFTLLTLPISVKSAKGKKKGWYLFALGIAAAYILLNPLRLLVNGMSDTYHFKLSSLWIIVLMLYMGSEGMDMVLKHSKRVTPHFIIIETVAIEILVIIMYMINRDVFAGRLLFSGIMLGLHAALLLLLWKNQYKKTFEVALICMCLIEVAGMAYRYVNSPRALNDMTAKQGLNDYSIEALEYIDGREKNNCYRVDKQYESYGANDSLYQDYMGIQSYLGGLGNRDEVLELFQLLNLPHTSAVISNPSLFNNANTLMGVKYILCKNGIMSNFGYEYMCTVEGIDIYQNQHYLPLVMGYDSCISREDFDKLSYIERNAIILKSCILEDTNKMTELEKTERESVIDMVELCWPYTTEWSQESDKTIFPTCGEDEIVAVIIEAENTADVAVIGSIIVGTESGLGKALTARIPEATNQLLFEFSQEGLQWLRFAFSDSVNIKVISVSKLPQELYYADYCSNIEKLKSINVENEEIDIQSSSYSGSISLEEGKVICFSIPYDEAWALYINGVRTELAKVNVAFIGTYLDAGNYTFELCYEPVDQRKNELYGKIQYKVLFVFWVICTVKEHRRREDNNGAKRV